jgi:lysophospholipase L1-like esterase
MKKTILVVQIAFALLAIPAFAGNDKNYTYLALGDSIPFGLNEAMLPPFVMKLPSPDQFVGYPETIAAAEHLLQSKKLVNASCPGETSGSFLSVNSLDYGCNFPHPVPNGPPLPPFKTLIGLKADYSGSQMDFAKAQLAENKHINMVSLTIGANDALLVLATCMNQTCVDTNMPLALQQYAQNLVVILTQIRANYHGPLVMLKYYSPSSPAFDTLAQQLNGIMTGVAANLAALDPTFTPIRFADGYAAFKNVGFDACQAGLLNRLPQIFPGIPPCDIHPSPLGRDILAAIVEQAFER